MLWRTLVWMLCGSLALAIPAMADLMIYPAKGQSQAQQDKDRYECHTWAVSQTGYDPSKPPPAAVAASPPAQRGGALRGAARGAAAGAAVGAIAGDAGKGAAAGAAGGGVLGAARQRSANRAAASQPVPTESPDRAKYDRALGACMEGRGYTVK